MPLLAIFISFILYMGEAQAAGSCHQVFSQDNPLPGQWVHVKLETILQSEVSLTGLNEFTVIVKRAGQDLPFQSIFSFWSGPHGELRFLELRYLEKAKEWWVSGRLHWMDGNWILLLEHIWRRPPE